MAEDFAAGINVQLAKRVDRAEGEVRKVIKERDDLKEQLSDVTNDLQNKDRINENHYYDLAAERLEENDRLTRKFTACSAAAKKMKQENSRLNRLLREVSEVADKYRETDDGEDPSGIDKFGLFERHG